MQLHHESSSLSCVSDAELRRITVDYTVEFARVFRSSSRVAAFSFLSGNGADSTGKSRLPYPRYKREAESALPAAGFPHVYIFRPAYIYPVESRMVDVVLPGRAGPPGPVLENGDIRAMVR